MVRLVAALNGLSPPSGDDFDYCELGCAHGDTISALAAAYPSARFLGIDLSAAHIASAKKLARDGALGNIGFLQRDMSDLVHEDIGEFDFISAHGLLSWVSPEKRRALVEFASVKLKPGGLLFVSYNALPGWSSVEPLRQLLHSPLALSKDEPGASRLDRARRGLEFAMAMAASGAEYFAKNPSATDMLATISKTDLSYVVHEYMHEHWTPMYFARVAWEMASGGLNFAGVLPPFLNFRDQAIPAALEPIFESVTDRVTFESMKDFAINEFFRRDLYVKGRALRSTENTNAYFDATAWTLRTAQPPSDRVVKLPHRTLSFESPIFATLYEALSLGGVTTANLATRPELAVFGEGKIRAALMKLAVAEHVIPVRTAAACPPVAGDFLELYADYNKMMLRRIGTDTPLVMVSPEAGTAYPISALEALAIRALTEVRPEGRSQWIRDLVARNVVRMRVADRTLTSESEQVAAITDAVNSLRADRIPKFVELGILGQRDGV